MTANIYLCKSWDKSEIQNLLDLVFKLPIYRSWKLEKQKDPPTETALIPSHYFFADAFKLALHWRLYYKSNKTYEIFGVPETAMARIIEWSRLLV